MEKIEKSTFKGIHFIELKSLPLEHAEALRQSLTQRTLIKIIQDDVILEDCVLYSAYEEWFEASKTNSSNNKHHPKTPLSISK
jgi:hypothetical protein